MFKVKLWGSVVTLYNLNMVVLQEISRFLLAFILFSGLVFIPAKADDRVLPSSRGEVVLSYAPLVEKAAPAVVNIYTTKKIQVQTSPLLNDPFFGLFFGQSQLFNRMGRTMEKEVNSLGSGVIVSAGGLIITNHHVVGDGDEIKIVLSDKREFEAKVVLDDKRTDLALLKIDTDGEKLPYLELDNSDDLKVGDIVLAIGNPFGVGQTVTGGIISALARTTVGISDFEFFIQTDAAINPGNSGGALVNMKGKIVGINTAIFSKDGGSNGIGFATPAIMAKVVLNSYNQGSKKIVRPWIGAATQNLTSDIAEALGLKKPIGVLVKSTYPGSPSQKAGLKTGDIIIKVDEFDVADEQSLKFRIATYAVGSKARFTILRDGKRQKELEIKMEPPGEYPPRNLTEIGGENPLSGATIANISPVLADELGIDDTNGVIIISVKGRTAASRFFSAGDIILAVNGIEPKTVIQLKSLIEAPKRGWKIKAKRGSRIVSIDIRQ